MGLGYSYIHDAVTDGNKLDSRKRLREEVGEVIGLGYVGHPLDTGGSCDYSASVNVVLTLYLLYMHMWILSFPLYR